MSTCTWHQDGDDSEMWATQCGGYFCTDDGTPTENDFRYCCYCGKPLVESRHEPENDDE